MKTGDGGGCNDVLGYDTWTISLYLIVYLCVAAAIGVIANTVVIFKTIIFERNIRRRTRDLTMTSTNSFVLSLSFSNVGTLSVSLLFYFWVYYSGQQITEALCRYVLPMHELFSSASIFSITFISVDRFLILFKGFREKMVRLSYKVWVAMLWVVCYVLFALPFTFVYNVTNINGDYVCASQWDTDTGRRTHLTLLIVFKVLLPGMVVFISYSGIIRSLKKVSSLSTNSSLHVNSSAAMVMTKSKRIVTVSVMMVMTFWLTYVPHALLVLYVEFGNLDASDFELLEILYAIAVALMQSGAMIFPLILLFSIQTKKTKRHLPQH